MSNFRKFVSKQLAIPLQDLLRGTEIRQEYSNLLKSSKSTIDELKRIQLLKLKNLIYYSYLTVTLSDDVVHINFVKIIFTIFNNDVFAINFY